MQPSLNYDEKDPKFILFGKVLKIIEENKVLDILNRNGVKNRSMMLISIKILFICYFFNYNITETVNELKRNNKLRKFVKINDVPNETQIYEFLSRYTSEQYANIVNSILKTFYKPHKRFKNRYIVDATPVACDINIAKKFITSEHLKKLRLKWGYSNSKGSYIGFKVTVVLEKTNLTPVSILIHPGAPNDAKLFDQILQELKRRHLIKPKDMILFDRGYYSYKNYQIGINKYKIVPVIFPRNNFNKNKFKYQMSYPLTIYKDKKEINKMKKLIKHLETLLLLKLENWTDLKPIRGIIEDFFKAAKGAFGLGKFHTYTTKSTSKHIYLCLLLTAIVVQTGFKTKTQLQQLGEGKILFKPPKTTKNKNTKEVTDKKKKSKAPLQYKQVQLDISHITDITTLDYFTKI